MMKKILMIGLGMLAAMTSFAGNKIELADITRGEFRGESMAVVKALADGESYAQMSADGKRIVQYSFKTGKELGVLFDVATAKGAQLESIDGYMVSPDGQRLLIQTNTKPIYRHSFTATYYIYTVRNNRLAPLSDNGPQQTPLFSPDGLQIAFVRDNNIFLVKLLYDNAEVPVTKDGKQNEIINGIPDWVNEEEFGHNDAMVFTADSKQLVWVRYDESQVREYSMSLFKGLKSEKLEYAAYPGFYTYKYPIAGEDNSKVSVWSFDISSRQKRQLQLPIDADGYIPRLKMTSDATQVAVYTLNRHQDCLRIFMCNPLSTVCKQIIEEKSDKYVKEDVLDGIQITDKHILLPSDRTGWMHLYLYNLNGQQLRQIDNGDYDVSAVYGYDEATGNTYFASHEHGATDQRVWVARQNGQRVCLSGKAGWSSACFSTGYKYFIHTWSDMNTPTVYTLCDNSGKVLTTLIDNHELVAKLSDYELGQRELFSFTTSEGVTLNGWMVKPANFNVAAKYPVVMYQYGGPGSQQVKNTWNIGMTGQGAIMEQYLCQQGYICVCVDNRGTGGRGSDFEKCVYQKLGQLEAKDQVETAVWLGQQPYVDKEHIAIWGWSFGGFNTLMAMSEGRDVFCAGIAIAPPTSWRYYDTIYTERYMRTPKENPVGYDDCPIARADKLHGELLLCHGMADDNVHFRNTAEYTEALVQADKDFCQLVYTNRNHSIYGGNTRQHLFRQCVNFFRQHLKRM
jgi:dipeptidyl-peptidase-4